MNEGVYEVSVLQLIKIVLKRWWIVLLAMIICAASAFTYFEFFSEPSYTSTAKVGINSVDMDAYKEAAVGKIMAQEVSDILKSNVVWQRAADILNDYHFEENNGVPYRKYTMGNVGNMISTKIVEDSRYCDLVVTCNNPQEAKLVADAVVAAFCQILDEREFIKEGEGKVISQPLVPSSPSSSGKVVGIIVGAAAGFIISAAILIIVYNAINKIDSDEWLIKTYGEKIPMLAVVPDTSSGGEYSRYSKKYGYNYKYGYSENAKK